MKAANNDMGQTHIGLLLIDGFPLMAYASVIEPFRAANTIAGKTHYNWRHISLDGLPVRASNGASLMAEGAVGGDRPLDILFVIMGGDPSQFEDVRTFAWLRDLGRRGVGLAGVSGGAYALARAGLLDGRRGTVHWEHLPAFTEAFPNVEVSPSLFVIDGPRMTCAGGVAALDMVIELIARREGEALASAVGDWFIRTQPRSGADFQRASLAQRYGSANDKVLGVLARMEATLEEPLPREALAREAGVGVRQLERLFAVEIGETVARRYLRLRLERSRRLVRETAMPLVETAMACGFADVATFSRAYSRAFGCPPGRDRRRTIFPASSASVSRERDRGEPSAI